MYRYIDDINFLHMKYLTIFMVRTLHCTMIALIASYHVMYYALIRYCRSAYFTKQIVICIKLIPKQKNVVPNEFKIRKFEVKVTK